MYCIDAARVVTGSKLVAQLQKSDAYPVKYQYEEPLTNPCLMSAELAVVRTALTCYSRHGRGLGPPMGWVGLGWVEF